MTDKMELRLLATGVPGLDTYRDPALEVPALRSALVAKDRVALAREPLVQLDRRPPQPGGAPHAATSPRSLEPISPCGRTSRIAAAARTAAGSCGRTG
mgnify:CR=1 FL=1